MDREISLQEKSSRRRRRMAVVAVAVFVIAGGVWWLASLSRGGIGRDTLSLSRVDRGDIAVSASASGKVVAAFEEILTSPVEARIVEVFRRTGDSVDAGTPLLCLDLKSAETTLGNLADELAMRRLEAEKAKVGTSTRVGDMEMEIRVKEMEIGHLESELRNERYLDSLGSGTGNRVDEADMALRRARVELEQLRNRLRDERLTGEADMNLRQLEVSISGKNLAQQRRVVDDARLMSPRKGVLTYINQQIGARVSPGEQVAVLADLSHFKIDCEIADGYASRVRPGNRAMVKLGAEQLTGRVGSVSPTSRNGVIAFTVMLDDDAHRGLRSGLRCDVHVLDEEIPSALRVANGQFYHGAATYDMWVVDGDEIVKRRVTVGQSNYEHVEIVDGLREGDEVVISDMSGYARHDRLRLK